MTTIAECIGGCADGVQVSPPDDNNPDDWPDYMEIQDKRTGRIDGYELQFFKSQIRDGVRVYFYKCQCVRQS